MVDLDGSVFYQMWAVSMVLNGCVSGLAFVLGSWDVAPRR